MAEGGDASLAEKVVISEEAKSLVRQSQIYADTVCFFQVFSGELKAVGSDCEVEADIDSTDGAKKRPDFSLTKGSDLSDVVEHKGSLPEARLATKELRAVATKYSKLIHEGKPVSPHITVLYPASRTKVVKAIKPDLPKELTLCEFDQATVDDVLTFKLDGQVNSPVLRKVLSGPIRYNPTSVRSTYKFIRADPPGIYTSFTIWQMLYPFRGVETSDSESFPVEREALLERVNTFCPPWIRNNLQLRTNRVGQALAFLGRLEFVSLERSGQRIIVHSEKGSRAGDLLRYFAQQWPRLMGSTEKASGGKRLKQLQLASWQDGPEK